MFIFCFFWIDVIFMLLLLRLLLFLSIGWFCGGFFFLFLFLMLGEVDEVVLVLLLLFLLVVGVGNLLLLLLFGVSMLVGVVVVDLFLGLVGGVFVVVGLVELLLIFCCSGEVWEGELFFLFCVFLLWFELWGEILLVCVLCLLVVSNLLKLGVWLGFDIFVWFILDCSCCRDFFVCLVFFVIWVCCVCGNWYSF